MVACPQFDYEIEWRPFFLDARLPKEGKNKMEHYKKKFGEGRVSMMIPQMQRTGVEDGIMFSYGGMIANTGDAHRLLEFAHVKGKQNELSEALFKRYFEREANLGDPAVLVDAAVEAGLDAEETRDVLESTAFAAEVEDKVRAAQEAGVSGVPHMDITVGTTGTEVHGAQDSQTLAKVFQRLAEDAGRAGL